MSFVIHQRDPLRVRSARVLHDGDRKWLIWSSEKIEVNNGERAVIVSGPRVEAHDAANVYSHRWIKSVVHPFTEDAQPPCPNCRPTDFGPDPDGTNILYD